MDLSVECCDSRNQKSPNGTPQDDVLAAEPCGRTPDDFTSLNCGTRFEDIREIFAHSQTATANSPGTNDSELALPDRYTGIEWLARGGMGSVYRAVDRPLSRFVAIKVATDRRRLRTGRQRFIAEARTLAQLQHPGIPAVYELGRQEDERPYIAMKLVNGRTLTELLQARSSPDDRLAYFLGIFRHVCDTMAYVHSQGVVHRDLKPENIMVGEFGEVQVMDWGLAKRLHGSTEETAASTDEGVDVESFRSDAPTPPEPELDAPWS
ncbi:MAG: serine/threonine protein kinase, partial [Planctomycetaceae bacterium]|nr:serine/threonine protein kinase [Planctomycetaceae bacterium]